MRAASIAFTKNGGKIARTLSESMGADGYIKSGYRFGGLDGFETLTGLMRDLWDKYDALVFVGACGIAVRAIAPYIRDKSKDPAVVAMDEKGKFVIPLLSGHIGGANALAERIARITGGTAVITTATDINNKFSVDTFAVRNNLHIGDVKLIKEISARVLRGEKIGLYSDYALKNIPDCFGDGMEAGICISGEDKKPFRITLNLKPRNIIIGVGCRKNCANVEEDILAFLGQNGADINSLCAAATADIKKNEKGIVDFCEKYGVPMLTFSAKRLAAQEGDFTSSEFVKKTVGTDNVCERAVCAAGADLKVKKTIFNGTALALGETETEIDFLKEK